MKEMPQYHLFTAELLRSILARSDDINLFRGLIERKSAKTKFASYFEKVTIEAEAREEQRTVKENEILNYFSTARIDSLVQKKYLSIRQLESIARKMLSISAQFESDDIGFSNPSEQHVYMVMNEKVATELETEEVMGSGRDVVVPKPKASSKSKILESCLFGETVSVALVLSHCVSSSREAFVIEISKCKKLASSESESSVPKISVVVNNRSSQELPRKQGASLPWGSNEWMKNMVMMLMDKNLGLYMKMKQFKEEVLLRQQTQTVVNAKLHISEDLGRKLSRAKSYQADGVFSQDRLFSLLTRSSVLYCKLFHYVLYDIDNSYFEHTQDLEERAKITHSVLVIQHLYKKHRVLKWKEALRHISNGLSIGPVLRKCRKLKHDRSKLRLSLWKLSHWYPLLVNRWREKRDKKDYSKVSYKGLRFEIVDMQRLVRGFLTRNRCHSSTRKPTKDVYQYCEWKTKLWRATNNETTAALASYKEASLQLRVVRQALVEDPRSAKVKRDRATTLEREMQKLLQDFSTGVKGKSIDLICA